MTLKTNISVIFMLKRDIFAKLLQHAWFPEIKEVVSIPYSEITRAFKISYNKTQKFVKIIEWFNLIFLTDMDRAA